MEQNIIFKHLLFYYTNLLEKDWGCHGNFFYRCLKKTSIKLEKKYAPALDNYGQSCFVRSDLKKK